METYAIFLYADGEIEWTTGDVDGGADGLGRNTAQIGFNRGDGADFGVIPISGTIDVGKLHPPAMLEKTESIYSKSVTALFQ